MRPTDPVLYVAILLSLIKLRSEFRYAAEYVSYSRAAETTYVMIHVSIQNLKTFP